MSRCRTGRAKKRYWFWRYAIWKPSLAELAARFTNVFRFNASYICNDWPQTRIDGNAMVVSLVVTTRREQLVFWLRKVGNLSPIASAIPESLKRA